MIYNSQPDVVLFAGVLGGVYHGAFLCLWGNRIRFLLGPIYASLSLSAFRINRRILACVGVQMYEFGWELPFFNATAIAEFMNEIMFCTSCNTE